MSRICAPVKLIIVSRPFEKTLQYTSTTLKSPSRAAYTRYRLPCKAAKSRLSLLSFGHNLGGIGCKAVFVGQDSKVCKFCGKPVEPDETCQECTLTDLELPPVLVYKHEERGVTIPVQAYLVEARTKERYEIRGPKWKIGRDPTNQVIIDEDPYTSRFHAWITFEEGHFFVEDLGSTNGTLLNGQPLVRRRPLVNGDRVRIGRSDFSFVVDHGAAIMGSRESASNQKEDRV